MWHSLICSWSLLSGTLAEHKSQGTKWSLSAALSDALLGTHSSLCCSVSLILTHLEHISQASVRDPQASTCVAYWWLLNISSQYLHFCVSAVQMFSYSKHTHTHTHAHTHMHTHTHTNTEKTAIKPTASKNYKHTIWCWRSQPEIILLQWAQVWHTLTCSWSLLTGIRVEHSSHGRLVWLSKMCWSIPPFGCGSPHVAHRTWAAQVSRWLPLWPAFMVFLQISQQTSTPHSFVCSSSSRIRMGSLHIWHSFRFLLQNASCNW